MSTPVPFSLEVPDEDIADLKARLALTRFPEQPPGEPWAYGASLEYMRGLIGYWHPSVYAKLLAEKMDQQNARCILLNTGWTGGAYGTGKRISIGHTRALLDAALAGDLDEGKVEYEMHPIFNLKMPKSCPNVPAEILNPRNTWEDKDAYDTAANKLADMFRKNFEDKGFGGLGIEPVI